MLYRFKTAVVIAIIAIMLYTVHAKVRINHVKGKPKMKTKPFLLRSVAIALLGFVILVSGCSDTPDASSGFSDISSVSETSEILPETQDVRFSESSSDSKYSSVLNVDADKWSLSLAASDDGITILSGAFGEMTLPQSELFRVETQKIKGASAAVSSLSRWSSVNMTHEDNKILLTFSEPDNVGGLTVELTGEADADGISWYTNVINASDDFSVTSVNYPVPAVRSGVMNVFVPERSGRVIPDTAKSGCQSIYDYPGHILSMQYFAFWGKESGIYIGIHDPDCGMKKFSVFAQGGNARLTAAYPAIGAGTAGNSFKPGGYVRWEAFSGDWYDATMLYAEFVHNNANWLPERGRPDTADKFKETAMWVTDYFEEANLAAILKIREYVGAPIASHMYGWHKIQFDTDYPHFLPSKDEAYKRFQTIHDADVYVVPYINGVSWETRDGESGYGVNYENTGRFGTAVNPDGSLAEIQYGNLKPSGAAVKLATICPGYEPWHDIMRSLVRDMEKELAIDGVYFDQIAAVAPIPCRSAEHGHTPGGGSWWSENYNEMINDIKKDRPAESFYISESNGEAYVGSFDGLLTWMWNLDDIVPAFSVIYSGYVQMVGRNTDVCSDEAFFRYHFAQSMLFGQQPGWFNARTSLDEDRLSFIKKVTDARLENISLFNGGKLLREPKIQTDAKYINASNGDTLAPVLTAVWQSEDGGSAVLFAVNITSSEIEATFTLYPEEYGVDCDPSMSVKLAPNSVITFDLNG